MRNEIRFLLKIGVALQELGMDAHRLESALNFMAAKLQIQVDVFSMPTSLMIAITDEGQQKQFFKRTEPGEIHLEKLSYINDVGNEVCAGTLSIEEALRKLEELDQFPERYSKKFCNLFFGLVSSCVAIFIGGNLASAALAFVMGILVGVFILYKSVLRIDQIYDAVAVFVVSLFSYAVASHFTTINPYIVILSSILVLIPGVTLTIAVTELAAQHLVAGTARFMLALMVFFKIAFGVALATKLISLLGFQVLTQDFAGYGLWVKNLGLILASLCLAVLFRSAPRNVLWISLSCFLGSLSSQVGQEYLGSYLGLMLGGCAVAVGSNLFTRFFNRPILVTLLPGILVLVPGVVGFQSLNYLYQNDLLLGINAAFKLMAMVVSLVAGIFIGNLVIRTEQHL